MVQVQDQSTGVTDQSTNSIARELVTDEQSTDYTVSRWVARLRAGSS